MNKKYVPGNYNISNTFSNTSYSVNMNYNNNKLNYSVNLFPYTSYINDLSLNYENMVINSFVFSFYYNIIYNQTSYLIYDYLGDYDEALFKQTVQYQYDIYESMNYILYVYEPNNDNIKYKLIIRKTNNEYVFKNNSNYPFKINYYNGVVSKFVDDVFSQPITWLMSLIEDKL